MTAARLRGLAAALLVAVGLIVIATTGDPLGLSAGLSAAGLGAGWLGIEWWAARAMVRERREEAEALRSRLDGAESSRKELEHRFDDLWSHQTEVVNSARLRTLGSLTAGIAHELDTPLGSLRSNLDTLRRSLDRLQDILADEQVDESELDDVRRIVRAVDGVMQTNELAVERLVELVGSLRTFARPDRSERDRIDVHQALDETLRLLEHELKAGVRVERDFGDLPRVECYPAKLNQAFMNLLVNACHAVDGDGLIALRTRAEDGRVRVEIRDTGCGISDDDMQRIFEPGFTTKGSRVGMGLGLPITQQVVEEHGGRLHLESEPGVGTTAAIELPVEMTGGKG